MSWSARYMSLKQHPSMLLVSTQFWFIGISYEIKIIIHLWNSIHSLLLIIKHQNNVKLGHRDIRVNFVLNYFNVNSIHTLGEAPQVVQTHFQIDLLCCFVLLWLVFSCFLSLCWSDWLEEGSNSELFILWNHNFDLYFRL